jgi:octaprenyl-diphosphate synthase
MSEAVNVIAEGEVLQLMNVNDPDITEETTCASSTARRRACLKPPRSVRAAGRLHCGTERALQDYGRYLGTAFQLIDDLLDYSSDGERLGKNVGDDLNEGKPTLPLLHAMHHGTPISRDDPRGDRAGQRPPSAGCVLETMATCGSLEWTQKRAEEEADKAIAALQILPDTPWREALDRSGPYRGSARSLIPSPRARESSSKIQIPKFRIS